MGIPILGDPIDGGPELHPNVPKKVDYKFEYIELGDSLKGFFTEETQSLFQRNTRRR